jgi:hypothetical protein
MTATMPSAGDVSPGFISEAGRCWAMVYDHNLRRPTVPLVPCLGVP